MRIDGQWVRFDDGEFRPVVRGQIMSFDGSPTETLFMVDTGADRTVLTRSILDELGLPATQPAERVAGVGGIVDTVEIVARVQFRRDGRRWASFRGRFSAVIDEAALDVSVLGRDIIGLFASIVDRPGETVCLIRPPHRYSISLA